MLRAPAECPAAAREPAHPAELPFRSWCLSERYPYVVLSGDAS